MKKFNKDQLLFVPLGGSGEIGMNINLYHYGGKWIMIDCGAGFTDHNIPGTKMMVGDLSFLEEIRNDLLGVIITHAHEDHFGGLIHCWNEISVPIYCTPLVAELLRAKEKDAGVPSSMDIRVVQTSSSVKLKPFQCDFITITHSVPEMQAVVISTPKGNIFHTGDWKIDENPRVEEKTDFDRIAEYGKKGILAMTCDSTNIFKESGNRVEEDVYENLLKIVSSKKNGVIVTTFASNIARIKTLADIAIQTNRKPVLAGRSLWRIVTIAQKLGYLDDIEFLTDQEGAGHPSSKTLVIATGCQGEDNAMMNRIIEGKAITKVKTGDCVIFSSKIIPGNDKFILELMNKFVLSNIQVISELNEFVHVSGHPSRQELQYMYEKVQPHILIPVHGEHIHLEEHRKFAKKCGIPHSIRINNGNIIDISESGPRVIGQVPTGYFGIDGKFLVDSKSPIISQRRKIGQEGVIIVTMTVNGRSFGNPSINSIGLLDEEQDTQLISELIELILDVIHARNGTIEITHLKSTISKFFRREMGKEPFIRVNLVKI